MVEQVGEHSDSANAIVNEKGLKIGPFQFSNGVMHRHVLVGIYAGLTTIGMVVYINIIQPGLLLNVLEIPFSEVGSATGRLGAIHEIVAIITMSMAGVLSDRHGRRLIYSIGFLVIGVGYFIYPLADSLTQLMLFRIIFAVGSGTILVMITTVSIDYSHESSRGKWLGFINLVSGIGVMILTVVMTQIPAMLESSGYDAVITTRYVFWIAAALCFCSAAVLGLGLKGALPSDSATKPSPLASAFSVLKFGMRDRMLRLTYGAAFIGRGDLAIIGMFLPLWVTSAALEAGFSTGEATVRAGTLLVIHQIAVVGWAFFAGYLNDRFNKVNVLVFAFILASLGYFSLWAVNDPFSPFVLIGIVVLAAGEISIIITNNAMAGERAPKESMGAVIGFLGAFGGIGIAIATFAGGEIFDAISTTAPFIMMVFLNSIIIVWALVVRRHGIS